MMYDCRKDIFLLCKHLNGNPTRQQSELFKLYQSEQEIDPEERCARYTIRSGHGTGKTYASSILALHRAIQQKGSLVVVTAPSLFQVKRQWFGRLRKTLREGHPLLRSFFTFNSERMDVLGDDQWGIWARSAAETDNFAGFHETCGLTFIFDEASGIEREIFETALFAMTEADSMAVAIGNPIRASGFFYDSHNKSSVQDEWVQFHFDSRKSEIVNEKAIERLAREFGVDSNVFRIRAKGEFPLQDDDAVFSRADLEACVSVSKHDAAHANVHSKQIGIDLARFGPTDESVVTMRQGNAVVRVEQMRQWEPMDVVDRAFELQAREGWSDAETSYVYDAGGMGQGNAAQFKRAHKKFHEFHTTGRSPRRDCKDAMTAAWFQVRELVKSRSLHLPDDSELIDQLADRTFHYDTTTQLFLVESKKDYRKRTGKDSPDRADSFVMAFFDPTNRRFKTGRKDKLRVRTC